MKFFQKTRYLLVAYGLILSGLVSAQTDRTNLITNPSFELGNLTGWTWTGTTGYTWLGPNNDGDATKNGTYICGIWNAPIGDAECAQTITNLPNGYYRVSALATVSANRTTNQRLFANSVSKLYGKSNNSNYSAANLAILTTAGESYTFGGYDESLVENGPFKKLSVVTQVTNGTLKLGIRVSGSGTTKGYMFTSVSGKNDIGFFKFDNFTLTEVSSVATLDNIELSAGALDQTFASGTSLYTASLPMGTKTVTPLVVPSADGQIITGTEAVDVSSGSGTSTITVKSIDGTVTKVYTVNYTVLTSSPFSISSYVADTAGINFQLVKGKLRLNVCNDKIIQVSYTPNSTLPQKDTIIVNKVWGKSNFTVTEDVDNVIISTQSLTVKVTKAGSVVSYFDKSGNLLVSEDSKEMIAATVLGVNTNTCIATFNSPVSEGLYGLGQHQQKIMNYKGQSVTMDQQNTEIALPFLVTTKGYGILWDNYSLTNFKGDVAVSTKYQFSSESGNMVDYYFMYGPEMDDVIKEYRTASGAAPMFPKWAYGLFQSKDKYSSQDEILTLANKYRAANLPLDCIVQDWDYWTPDFWGSHTMNATRYSDPKALIDSLHAMNIHTMISIWPVFHSSTTNYQAFNSIGAIYPSAGAHHFYDPHNDAAKKIYWSQVNTQLFSKYGWDSWWADNDEPQGYPDGFDRKNFMTAKGSGVTYYNTYPIQHTAAVYNGWRQDIANKRLFTLSRSAFPGQQRYATAAWSGDITSDWGAFQRQLSGGLNFCLSGMPYWTTDIGGYVYTDWSTVNNNELMIRWFQYGAFCPIFRIHGQGEKALVSNTLTQATKDNLATTDKLRYRLMPYIYSLAWKVTNESYTMMRHLVMDYRTDANVKNIDNQFLFGPSMMVNPVTSAGVNTRTVYLPAGGWFDFWTGKTYAGSQTITTAAPLDKMPIFVKAGAIIPMGPDIMHANQVADPTEIRVYKGANGSFTLYEDEGDTYNYEKGQYAEIPFTYNDNTKQLTIGARSGSFTNMLTNRTFKVVLVGENYGTGSNSPVVCDSVVHYNGTEAIVTFNVNKVKPQLHYEAENATLSGTAAVATAQAGYSGTGYVNGLNLSKNSKVTFNVNVPKAGLYKLNLRYSAGTVTIRRNLKISVNSNQAYNVNCENTKDWNTWNVVPAIAKLDSGANTIQYSGDSVFVALDCLDLTLPTSAPYYLAQNRVCRIKQMNGTKYMGIQGSDLLLGVRDTISKNQLWNIEKISSTSFKITSMLNGKCISVDQSSLSEGAKITNATYSNTTSQQWSIDDFGLGIFKLTAKNSSLCLAEGTADGLIQNADGAFASQRWVFEDTIATPVTAIYEPFDYATGSNLNGLGNMTKGWGTKWTVYEGTATDMTIQAAVPYATLTTSGNKLAANLTTATGLRASRDLFPRWADDGSKIWVSFLMDLTNPTALANSWQGLSLFDGGAEKLLIGKNWGKTQLGISQLGGNEGTSTISALGMQPTWIVVMIKTTGDATNENVYMWINPDTKSEPLIASANATAAIGINNGFDRIVCHLGQTAGLGAGFDEIRIGRTFANVVSSTATGTKDLKNDKNQCIVYPNPATDKVSISFVAESAEKAEIKFNDLTGKCIYTKSMDAVSGVNTLSLNTKQISINSGVYFVSITCGGNQYTNKCVFK